MQRNRNVTVNPSRSQSSTVKKPTREDLLRAAEVLASAAESGIEDISPPKLSVKSTPRGTRDNLQERRPDNGVRLPAITSAAAQTGHGAGRGGARKHDGPLAFEQFMDALNGAIKRGANRLRVTDNKGFVKIESLHNGHKIYVAKTLTTVTRVESTIPPDRITGAAEPDRENGRIASWIPADPGIVAEAVRFLVEDDDMIRPPVRGAGDTSVDRQRTSH